MNTPCGGFGRGLALLGVGSRGRGRRIVRDRGCRVDIGVGVGVMIGVFLPTCPAARCDRWPGLSADRASSRTIVRVRGRTLA